MLVDFGTKILDFNVALPKGSGKNKNKIASLNEVLKWHWKSTTECKNGYKDLLKNWYLSKSTEDKYEKMSIVFELHRHNNRMLDSDNIGLIIKWTIDAIKELDYLIDDDQITYMVIPSKLNRDVVETQINVKCYVGEPIYDKKEK
jgi:hypothetical protein